MKIEKKLWNIAKRYKKLFDTNEVPQISESEKDRLSISEAYLEIETKRHRQLDARVYRSLTKMQRARDAKIALEGTTEKDRLRMIAWEVKTRTQPIIFSAGDSTLEMDIFNMHTNDSVKIIDGDKKDIEVEDSIISDKGIAILESLPLRKLTKEEKELLKEDFIVKYAGKKYNITEFKSRFDNIFADLISLLVRERRIMLLRRFDDIIEIMKYEDFIECQENMNCDSKSIVLFPKKKLGEL